MSKPPPRLSVTLDIGPAVHQGAGLSRYAEQLAAHLRAHHAAEIDLRLFYNAHSGHGLPEPLARAPVQTLPLGQYAWRLSVLASQLARLPYAPLLPRRDTGPTIYHATEHLLPCLPQVTVLTVHDLIFERYPQHHTRANRLFLRLAMPRFVAAARHIIAVSRQTQRDLVELYRADPSKITVVYNGVEGKFQPAGDAALHAVRSRYSPDRPYLLMLGTLEPRKNHRLALLALARLKAAGHPHRLVLAGGRGWLFEPVQQEIARLGLQADVTFPGYIPDTEIAALYSAADCVLMPSLYEGFGLPLLEAMACGAPVVASNASSLPEVGGDAALYTTPHDDEAFAAAVHLVLSQPALAAALRARSLARAQEFTWTRCAQQTVAVYRAAAAM